MTNNKALANRRNALLSTGPKTAAGRARSTRNALTHGLYTAAVVPALGESDEALGELRAAIHQVLRPEGVLEERLCDRVALFLLRFDRVARFEAATANGAATALALPPDPDTITGDGIDICVPPRPESPPAFRLAFARARLAGWAPVRAAFRAAVATLAGEPEPDVTVPGRSARRVVFEVGAALGWDRDEACERWAIAAGSRPRTGGPVLEGFLAARGPSTGSRVRP